VHSRSSATGSSSKQQQRQQPGLQALRVLAHLAGALLLLLLMKMRQLSY
jgi:hypothetical protein